MQSNIPPTTFPTSTASTCRWKRGRPVSVRPGSSKPIGTPSLFSPRLSLQHTTATEGGLMAGNAQFRYVSTGQHLASPQDADAEASNSKALHYTQLADPQHAVYFTPASSMEAQHGTCTDDSVGTACKHATSAPTCEYPLEIVEQVENDSRGARLGRSSTNVDKPYGDSFATETTSQDDDKMSLSSDSDYVPSQEEEGIANEQLQEEIEDLEEEEDEVEQHIDLDYQIPEDTLRAAMLASPKTRASFWSAKMYRGPEDQPLSTHYCQSLEVAERVAQYFLKEKVVGFDIEWRPFSSPNDIKKNASLIQLACEDRIALFHVSQFTGNTAKELMPPTLKTILESPDILKVGVAVKGDFTRLQKYLNIQAQGVFELSRLHNLVEWHATDSTKVTNKLVGLGIQVLQHLQLPLYKGEQLADDPADTPSVRESDWSKPLDLQQVHYAAADAYAGFRLYHILEWKRKQLRPTPPTRGLCDYDSKRDPKPKVPKKKTTRKPKAAVTTATDESISSPEQDQDDQLQHEPLEMSASEEEEGYETAPEEFIDSHELEGRGQASSFNDEPRGLNEGNQTVEKNPARKRAGRVDFSRLRGLDPQYPVLPQLPDDSDMLSLSPLLVASLRPSASKQSAARSSRIDSPQSTTMEEDEEFADSELEEALQDLDLDKDGKLINTSRLSTRAIKSDTTGNTSIVTLSPDPGPVPQVEETEGLDLTDYNPIRLELGEAIATAPSGTVSPTTVVDEPSHTPEYNSATTWAQKYLESTIPSPSSTTPSRIRATIPHLRAYHLWHHQSFSLDNVASHLRDPPLSHSTVTGYILQAVTLERLEYDADKLRDVMMGLPIGMRKGRWRWIAEKVGAMK